MAQKRSRGTDAPPAPQCPPKRRYSENVVVSCDVELKQWLTSQAKREDRPVGQLCRILIKEARSAREAAVAQ